MVEIDWEPCKKVETPVYTLIRTFLDCSFLVFAVFFELRGFRMALATFQHN